MEVIIAENQDQASEWAARKIKNKVKSQPNSVLGMATGSTPLSLYKKVIGFFKQESIDHSQIRTFNLDEYVGVRPDHPGSYSYYMQKNWLQPLGLSDSQFHIPNGNTGDILQECEAFEALLKKWGPIDLQILGLGRDGHIGFNEPGSSLGSRTRLKSLTEQTIEDNKSVFSKVDSPPRHVITMGVQTIMEAQEILLLAFGKMKAQAVKDFIEGPITSMVPASILQMHPKVQVFLDAEASSLLQNQDYYREVFANKPDWQMAELTL